MKKKLLLLSALVLSSSYYPLSEIVTEASAVEVSSYSKTIYHTVYVGKGSRGGYPPSFSSSYYYNDGRYAGTLFYSTAERRSGNEWYVTYSGTVSTGGHIVANTYEVGDIR